MNIPSIDLRSTIADGFAVRSVQTWEGREGYGFKGVLTRFGSAVAVFRDDGDGGEMDINWKDDDASKRLSTIAGSMPPVEWYGEILPVDESMVIAQLCDSEGRRAPSDQ